MALAVAKTASGIMNPVANGATKSVSFGSLPSAGSLIVVVVTEYAAAGYASAGTVTDNQGNTYTTAATVQYSPSSSFARTSIFYAKNIGTPSGTFTVTFDPNQNSGSVYGYVGIAEVAGADTTAPLDQTATNGNPTSSNPATCSSGTTSTTSQANEVVFAGMGIDGGTNPTGMALPSGYTNLFVDQDGSTTFPCRADYKIVSATGTQSASWGSAINPTGGAGIWAAVIATFKEASGGGGSTPTVTDASDENFYDGETSIPITGTNFGASQGVGTVKISPTDNVADGGAITQTVTAWSDTSITMTAVKSTLAANTNLYLFVTNNGGSSNAAGYTVQFGSVSPLSRNFGVQGSQRTLVTM